ncbi:MAG: FAD-binding oxidoreductase [Planctomycetota bacterium]
MRTHWSGHEGPIPARVDTAIIGAGVTGLSAAIALHELGVEALVIERGTVGAGASTKNAGYLMRGGADNYHAAIELLGRDGAIGLWRATEDNLESLVRLGVEGVEGFARRPSSLLAYDEDEALDIERSARAMCEDGFDAELVTSGDDTLWSSMPPRCALVNTGDAVVNPERLIAWLRSLVRTPIAENAEVFAIDADDTGVRVRTSLGDVHASRVLVCANAWASRLIDCPVVANRGQMLAIRVPDTVRLDHAYYANRGSEYFRVAEPGIVVVGGWRKHFEDEERTDTAGISRNVQGGLEDFAERALGGRYQVVRRWGGVMGFTPDGLPRVGPTDDAGRVWCCCGFTGHGMSLGHITATHAARAMVGLGDVPAWSRPPIGGVVAG